MTIRTLAKADQIYRVSSQLNMTRLPVPSEPVERFSSSLRTLERNLGEARQDEYWTSRLPILRRRRFAIQATPLPSSSPALDLLATIAIARASLDRCAEVYPDSATSASEVCDALWNVFEEGGDPLGSAVADVLRETPPDSRSAVLLANHGYESLVQTHLEAVSGVRADVVSPFALSERLPYDLLVVIGSPFWYERKGASWVFTSPRAEEVILIGFPPQATAPLPSNTSFSHSRTGVRRLADVDAAANPSVGPLDDSLEPDWAFVPEEVERRRAAAGPAERVEARLCVLGGGVATFLPASEEARIQTLDLDSPPGKRLVSLSPSEIGPGTFILLRIEGGGDLIVIVADAVLGSSSSELREMQRTWKERLRERVRALGIEAVARNLRSHGSLIADRGNIANWSSPRSIRPESRIEFDAIMKLVGFEADAKRYWNAMGEIHRAHRSAGFAIRRRLDALADRVDSGMLSESGRIDFRLEEGGGALAAFRVEAISPTPLQVAYDQLGELFDSRIR